MKKRIIIAAVLFNLIFSLISIHSYATDLLSTILPLRSISARMADVPMQS
jgi:hypothetical protein